MASLSKSLARTRHRRLLCVALEKPLSCSHLNRTPRRHLSDSTEHPDSAASMRSGNFSYQRGILALSCILSGFIGFKLAKTWGASSSEKAGGIERPRYGTAKDFEQAIQELKEAFSDADAVSTDPEDLRIHGFSDYDYRPGALSYRIYDTESLS
ncbi:hypothetical protein C0993_003426 [Termitomyces sp. T159_Od127]|nr:hypothetical protein C0993_003426 [Termitomyces sp. T159_Od127]